MATAKTVKQEPTTKKLIDEIPEEAKEAAAAQLKEMNETPEANAPRTLNTPRKKRGGASSKFTPDTSMRVSEHAPKLDVDNFGPTAFAAVQYGGRTGSTLTQEFTLDEDRVKYLCFTPANQNLPKKRLYTIKAFHRDGRLVQLPFELQIQNTAGGDMEDAIGLRRYERKGISLLIDWATMQPIYCAAWGCHAKADGQTGFCGPRHAQHTLPNKFKDAGAISAGVFGENATTSRMWEA